MTTTPRIARALRRLLAASDHSINALWRIAEIVDAQDRPLAVALLSIADLLDGATVSATLAIAREPTAADEKQAAAILEQIAAYSPSTRLPDELAPAAVQ